MTRPVLVGAGHDPPGPRRGGACPARSSGNLRLTLSASEIPRHVGIIMDGNGRWARLRGRPHSFGHRAGVRTIRRVLGGCEELGIGVLSVYAFSTENWSRPRAEVR